MTRTSLLIKCAAVGTMMGSAVACMDLEVTNLNEPDRGRALNKARDVESLIAGTFRTWWDLQQGRAPGPYLSAAAEELTSSAANYGTGDMNQQPRIPVPNMTGYQWGYPLEDPWMFLNRALAAVRDGLLAIDEQGLEIGPGGADNPRIQAFAKFMQGLSHGFIALMYDQGYVLDETVAPEEVVLRPYGEVMTAARGYLAQAREIASQNAFTTPAEWMGASYTNEDIVRLAHSYEARFMAQVARSPEERAQVDWATVLSHVEQGIVQDFGIELDGPDGVWTSTFKQFSDIGNGLSLRFVGPADQSGGWQAWEAADPLERMPFLIDTDDRRINGGDPESSGKYVQVLDYTINEPERGVWFMTNYSPLAWREIAETEFGFAPDLTVEEMDFLAAEAHIRLGSPEKALPVINRARVAIGELPPATVNGVSGDRCVPRTITGECGDLLATLHYEKKLETIFLSAGSSYYDSRGFGTLRTGTAIHFPVPAAELEALDLPVYTFGGVGGEGAAP